MQLSRLSLLWSCWLTQLLLAAPPDHGGNGRLPLPQARFEQVGTQPGAPAVVASQDLLSMRVHKDLAPPASEGADARSREAERGTNLVRLCGRSFCDDQGPFLGLGASYFQALRHARYDRARLDRNLAFLATNGFNYIRVLSMVSWDGLEIAPVALTNRAGHRVEAWPDYWPRFCDLLEAAAQHGLRVEITVFADAQYVMPAPSLRVAHLDGTLEHLAGREHQVMHLEVANEGWQNGFPGAEGVAELRAYAQYLADRTPVLVAITSNDDTGDSGIAALYRGSAADLATVHFSRDTHTTEGGWLPVRDCYRAGRLPGVPPVTSNEPIGPGSSVNSESDPVKLCAAAVFAYVANLPGYVFHSSAGVYARDRFEDTPGIGALQFIRRVLPADLANWERNDGLEPAAPFTVSCNGQPNRYWPDVPGATNGCHRNIGSVKGEAFVSFPMGILGGGLTLEARRPLKFEVLNPLTGQAVSRATLTVGDRLTLPQGPGAYLLRGTLSWLSTSPEPWRRSSWRRRRRRRVGQRRPACSPARLYLISEPAPANWWMDWLATRGWLTKFWGEPGKVWGL